MRCWQGNGISLVQCHTLIDDYRARQSAQTKAWFAGNGHSLAKSHNAGLGALSDSLRATQEALIRFVVTFEKGITLSGKPRLTAKRFLSCCSRQLACDTVLVTN